MGTCLGDGTRHFPEMGTGLLRSARDLHFNIPTFWDLQLGVLDLPNSSGKCRVQFSLGISAYFWDAKIRGSGFRRTSCSPTGRMLCHGGAPIWSGLTVKTGENCPNYCYRDFSSDRKIWTGPIRTLRWWLLPVSRTLARRRTATAIAIAALTFRLGAYRTFFPFYVEGPICLEGLFMYYV